MTRPAGAAAYEDDFVAWVEDQAQRARRGELDALDLDNIAEELEGMARSDHRRNQKPPDRAPRSSAEMLGRFERRAASGLGTIAEQRDSITTVLDDSPSLRTYPAEILDRCYPSARRKAAYQMRLSEPGFREDCRFAIGEVLDRRGLPPDRTA